MKSSITLTLTLFGICNALNMMSMIDGVDLRLNSYFEIENVNDATIQYVDERADIYQILTVDIVSSHINANNTMIDYVESQLGI